MLDKDYLIEIVSTKFPDIGNTNFIYNNNNVSEFTESTLLPFLVYQNTVDTNNRLIGLFLPENSNGFNIVPFYTIMAHYRKALNKIMKSKHYENNSFGRNEKQIVLDGSICAISSVDYINRQILLQSGSGRQINLSFNQSYKIKWEYENAIDIRNRIEAFEKIDNARQHNIFTFPLTPAENLYEGVVIFTNISKFESLLRNIKISKNDIRDHLNIEKVVFPKDGTGYNFVRLSSKQTENKPVSVLVARLDAFRAYHQMLEYGGKKYQHLKTIIIDEFDDNLMRWNSAETASEELENLAEDYFQKLKEGKIKDIYLICKK